MKLVLASNNKHKIAEIHSILEKNNLCAEILSLSDIGYTDEIVEDGTSFEENAMIKAKAVAALGYIGIADDSGLSVDALDGAPGIYSARYAGEPCDHQKNNEKLLQALSGLIAEKRSAAFVSVIACVTPSGASFTVRGECRGEILTDYRGSGGFGYDPLFRPNGYDITFAELSFDEKNTISHRAKALAAFAEELPAFLKKQL